MRDAGGRVESSDGFRQAMEKLEVGAGVQALPTQEGGWRLQVSQHLYEYLLISDEAPARGLAAALRVRAGDPIDRDALLAMPVPVDDETREAFDAIVARYRGGDHQAAIEEQVDRIDALAGPALGLDAGDLQVIRADMLTDPFLKNIVPRWPGSATRLHGYRTGLDSAERYA